MKTDITVAKETKYIAFWTAVFSVILQTVFIIIGKWDYTVLLGNILSGTASVLNFFLMGIMVQGALEKSPKNMQAAIKASQLCRIILMLAVTVIGAAAPCFDIWTVIIPLLFPRTAIAIRPFLDKRKQNLRR